MSPPLISAYKKPFAYKRICQTLLGGVKIFSPLAHVLIQLLIFVIPVPLLISFVYTEHEASHLLLGICVFLVDVFITLSICGVKRSARIGEQPNTANFLDQDDEIINEGCLKASTWVTIAPDVNLTAAHFAAVLISAASFTLCSPVIFQSESMTDEGVILPPIWLRCLSVYTMCNSRYSSVINLPPEIATFDSVRRKKDILYRPFYTFTTGLVLFLYHRFCSVRLEEDVAEYETCSKLIASVILSFLPFLWGFGILPPLDAFFPWSLEMLLRFIGGNPGANYFATFISIIVAALSFVMTFLAGSFSNQLILILIQCVCSYFVSSDTALLLSMNANLCEDTPPQKLIWSTLKPCAIILTSIVSIMTYLLIGYHIEIVLLIVALLLSVSSVIIRKFWCTSMKTTRGKIPTGIFMLYNSVLKFVLHCWIAGELDKLKGDNRYSLMNLMDYLFNIRAFAKATVEPKYTSIDLAVATLWRIYISDHKFTLILFLVSTLRSRVVRGLKYLKLVTLFTQAAIISPLLSGMKLNIAAVSITTFPISIASLVLATVVEGATVTPIFTLPIFLIGFPRPVSFWKGQWFPSKKEMSNELKSLDNTIYSQIAPAIAKAIVGKAKKSCFVLDEGSCYLARHEDRLIFIRIVTSGWNYVYVQVKGLEMQEQTSCHHQESAWLDEIFEASISNSSICSRLKSGKDAVMPMMSLQICGTYSESKSNIDQLSTKEDKIILKCMFFRAFSYLWIESNPIFKGESYTMKTTYQFSKLNVTEFTTNEILEPVGVTMLAKSGQESIRGLTYKPKEAWSYSTEEAAPNNNVDSESESMENSEPRFSMDTDDWIKLCVGQVIPSNAVKKRIERLCDAIWKYIITDLPDYEGPDVELEQFFTEHFEKKVRGFKSEENSSTGKLSIHEITVKAFRYGMKLTLDEIYNGPTTENIQIFEQLTSYERNYSFVKYADLPYVIREKFSPNIVTMIKYDDRSILKMYTREPVEFHVGKISRYLVEGIWANLNLELMYLTSDDDERFSIQHDRKLMRNICTQCANSPLGYPVYDAIFRVSNCTVDLL